MVVNIDDAVMAAVVRGLSMSKDTPYETGGRCVTFPRYTHCYFA